MKSPGAGQESEKLLSEGSDAPIVTRTSSLDQATVLKYGSLAFLILQNSSHVLLLRYSRVVGGECSQYVVRRRLTRTAATRAPEARIYRPDPPTPRRPPPLQPPRVPCRLTRPASSAQTSVAVLFAELFKMAFCLVVLTFVEGGPLSAFSRLDLDIWQVASLPTAHQHTSHALALALPVSKCKR